MEASRATLARVCILRVLDYESYYAYYCRYPRTTSSWRTSLIVSHKLGQPKMQISLAPFAALLASASAFQIPPRWVPAAVSFPPSVGVPAVSRPGSILRSGGGDGGDDGGGGRGGDAAEKAVADADEALKKMPAEVQKVQVGNLVADDEWMGLGMEIAELVRTSIIEGVKEDTKEFIGKDEYKVGDISKELDSRVKDEVAKLRGKGDGEYELGDLTLALDQMSKDFTCELTGKDEYEAGDLTNEIDARVKDAVASFCGKEDGSEYEVGDLTREVNRRVEDRVADFTGKGEYTFGDISREIENKRRDWVKSYLGEEAANNYEFGDLTKKAIAGITGKDTYEFGDVSKAIFNNLFGPRKRGGGGKK